MECHNSDISVAQMVSHVDTAVKVTTPAVSVRSEKPTSAPPHLSEVPSMLFLKQFRYLSD